MTDWFYVAEDRQRRGPVDAAVVGELYRSGRIHLDTLVWREGQTQWRPLLELAAELGLADASGGSLPPPLPPAASAAPLVRQAAPPRSNMGGCAIAFVILAVLAVPVLAILAAIALPAYQDYTQRARVSGVLATASALKVRMVEHLEQGQPCPVNGEAGFGTPDSFARDHVASITVGEFESGLCGMELTLGGTGSEHLDRKALWLEYDPAGPEWNCSSEIDDKYLPADCRG